MRLLSSLLLLSLIVTPAFPRSRHRRGPSASGQPGAFDYYVLSLSWSPDFCSTHAEAPECGGVKKFGFVVHGLWPQNERGYPRNCAGVRFEPAELPADLHDIMPSDPLIRHEWQTHGACSGLSETAYFNTLEKAYQKVHIPSDYKGPLRSIEVTPADLKRKFVQANTSFPEEAISIQCGGRFLREVRLCLTKDLRPRACGLDIRETCSTATIIMRPLR